MPERVLIISYHFYPDTAVGAKRPSELACTLRDAGYQVDVIAAKTGAVNDLSAKIAGIQVTQVAVPPGIVKAVVLLLKRLKSGIHRSTGSADSRAGAQEKSAYKTQTVFPAETWYRRLRRWYFSCVALGDALKGWSLLIACIVISRRLYRQYDLVISSGPPMAVHNNAWLAKKIFRCPWVMDLRDPFPLLDFIYPEKNFMSADVKSPLRKNIELCIEHKNVQASDAIVTASPGIGNELCSRYLSAVAKLHTIYNGYEKAGELQASVKTRAMGKIIFLYAGSLYFNRNPFPLLEAFHAIRQKNSLFDAEFEVWFYGDCKAWNGRSLSEWIVQHGMESCVKIYPPVSSSEIERVMQMADVLINFCQGQPLQIPAKTFDYIGSGKISLVITEHDSDTARLIRESRRGVVLDPAGDNMVDKIIELCQTVQSPACGAAAEEVARYSRAWQNQRYQQLIKQLGERSE